jgi:glycosyltransferase involved in cell wall biosynthesis
MRYWFTFLAIPTVLRMAKEADIIHTTTYNGAFPAWLASKIYRKPCVITVHEIFGNLWGEFQGMNKIVAWLHKALERAIIGLGFTKYVGVSNCTSAQIKECGKEATTVYNGIDYKFFNPAKSDRQGVRKLLGLGKEFVYLYYGRPGLSKGVEYLISAVRLIRDKILKSKLLLILGREPKDRFKAIVLSSVALGIYDDIILRPSVAYQDLPSYIVASDCVVVPSLSEGFGFSAAEACAMGKPVVVSNVASLPEVVSGKYVLVEPRNPKAIVKGILDVYNGKVKKSELKRFTWDNCVDGYENIYEELLKNE